MVIGIYKAPFTGMPKPSILMRGVFTRVSLEGYIPICSITSQERVLTALPTSTNT
jgi:hypothetical protein